VRFLAFMVPSRTDLGVYRAYRDAVYGTIDEINARYADVCGGPPIRVFYTNDRDQALAAMQHCNVLLINSLQDGMNLVAKEWAVVAEEPGVLIVSETAGVAGDAADSALLISPLDVEGTARAMAEALDMPGPERRARHRRFRERVSTWSARDWLNAQLADLGVAEP
jgi:trehalose 6-phosphate synthase